MDGPRLHAPSAEQRVERRPEGVDGGGDVEDALPLLHGVLQGGRNRTNRRSVVSGVSEGRHVTALPVG